MQRWPAVVSQFDCRLLHAKKLLLDGHRSTYGHTARTHVPGRARMPQGVCDALSRRKSAVQSSGWG